MRSADSFAISTARSCVASRYAFAACQRGQYCATAFAGDVGDGGVAAVLACEPVDLERDGPIKLVRYAIFPQSERAFSPDVLALATIALNLSRLLDALLRVEHRGLFDLDIRR